MAIPGPIAQEHMQDYMHGYRGNTDVAINFYHAICKGGRQGYGAMGATSLSVPAEVAYYAGVSPSPPTPPSPPPPPPPNDQPAPPSPPPKTSSAVAVGTLGGACPGMVGGGAAAQKLSHCSGGAGWEHVAAHDRTPLPAPATDADVSGVHLADLNGDGVDELIVLTHAGVPSYIYENPGNGDFSRAYVPPTPIGTGEAADKGHSTSAAFADVNGDGHVDIVVGNEGTSNMIYLDGDGNFATVDGIPFGSANSPTTDVAVGDIDGDGLVDVAVANDGTPNVVYWGQPIDAGTDPSYAVLAADQPDAGASGGC